MGAAGGAWGCFGMSFFLCLFVCFCFSVQDTGVLMCVLGVLGRGDAEPDDCAVAGV